MTLNVFSNLKDSMTLWFLDYDRYFSIKILKDLGITLLSIAKLFCHLSWDLHMTVHVNSKSMHFFFHNHLAFFLG